MTNHNKSEYAKHMPKRMKWPGIAGWFGWIFFLLFFIMGLSNANITVDRLWRGLFNAGTFISQAFPPDFNRIEPVTWAMIETFEIAIVGTAVGVVISLPFALLSAKNITRSPLIRSVTRGLLGVMRTVPDLVWALIFVVLFGLGPLAGILTIMIDTIAFCARFFSERIEELNKGPLEALESTGSKRGGVIFGAAIPPAFPSFVSTGLFAFEKSIRGAVVLGLVGAGGIGVELRTSMTLMKFDEAAAIILLILLVVLAVEKVSSKIRLRVI
ncbi:phosphonate ABC transporter, permease protein PhnE [Jeotgalibacillus sp. ET6]|uniref:phosphonate ABC transporter, permease protein PhnE n=1 Tax=Jeotgalibacillus sp. ET6 TaxID=3037260 RepID=UPI002418A8F4|nr:phosphonate ABC transporter, permease protein PhnE [Jeotgalibacillus sp. ET6]MDG5472559.1 phosphonate ABC transporter, permease protein PhnE [Jeotgalibacillus sp. ET6]